MFAGAGEKMHTHTDTPWNSKSHSIADSLCIFTYNSVALQITTHGHVCLQPKV